MDTRFKPEFWYDPLEAQGCTITFARGVALGAAFGGYDSKIVDYHTKEVYEERKSLRHSVHLN